MTRPVALVTGASRGIGRAIALELAREGFDIAANDLTDGDELAALVAELRDMNANALALPFDVADLTTHETALEKVTSTLGPLGALINNAGVGVLQRGDPLDVSEASFDRCIAVNTKALFFLCQAAAHHLISASADIGHPRTIINVTSSNATAASVPRSEYCASKAAAAMISKCFAARLGPEGIAVYDVQPGLIETPMTAPVIDTYRQRAADGLCLLPWVGQPEDVARTVASLATGRLPYTTGHVISVDGGMLVPRF
ncbi:3-ketoacyl-ACP reductase [Alphaproteobacteria bacterium GH1-50]|uniref:3-ketoacyl-ACP reductase n=1 Tax=Kangsaoukella pontilimi TaxID=2691042 RepID=A0A7C9IFL7_9RHOB|nr:3-ketoacyl-ACP reductase [Kangsaoukella pontilimi]MXQ07369.1 3-ketoacyl-ACP reductase [Kangsaoukella pontilimi]